MVFEFLFDVFEELGIYIVSWVNELENVEKGVKFWNMGSFVFFII